MFWLGLIGQTLVFGASQFGAPVFALHLESYEGFSKAWLGCFFATGAVTYVMNSLLIATYCKIMSRKKVIFVGWLLYALSVYLLATSPLLRFQDDWRVIWLGMALAGASSAQIIVPLIPETLDCIVLQCPHLECEELNNVIAGYFNSALGIGEAVGPLSAGILVEAIGFRNSADILASLMVLYILVYLVVNGIFALLSPDKKIDDGGYVEYKDNNHPSDSIQPTLQALKTKETLLS